MDFAKTTCSLTLVACLTACVEAPVGPAARDGEASSALAAKAGGAKDPTTTWKIPLVDDGLSLRGDGLYGDGTYSRYANGVCGVSSVLFATAAGSSTGDATLQMSYPKGRGCGRTVTMVYANGSTETLATFSNLNKLQRNDSTSTIIPVGSSALRRLIIGFQDHILGNPSAGRCGRVIFGDNGSVGAGTDKLTVTRISSTTWRVESQAAPNNKALCGALGTIEALTVSFLIEANTALP